MNENLPSGLQLPHFDKLEPITKCQGNLVHISQKYYERIPQFYFVVGVLLLFNSIYLGINDFAAYFYLAFGVVSILYAEGVRRARAKRRDYPLNTDSQPTKSEIATDPQPESEVRDLP